VDISPFAIKKSKEFGNDNILMASAVNLPFRGASFDIITVIDALEHVVELTECLDEIERTLKKDGVLLLQLPNPLIWKYFFGALGLRDKSHVNNFWLKEWKKVLSERNMRIHKCYGIVSFVFRKLKFLLKSKMFTTLYPEWWVIAMK
jgi:ubiquinone/menaquinone biosynthesis C-methylase UbiE